MCRTMATWAISEFDCYLFYLLLGVQGRLSLFKVQGLGFRLLQFKASGLSFKA